MVHFGGEKEQAKSSLFDDQQILGQACWLLKFTVSNDIVPAQYQYGLMIYFPNP